MKIVLYGHPVLRQKSVKVENIDESLREKLNEMVKLMRKANGIGLAANQVETAQRFFVLEVDGNVKKIINPEILEFGDEIVEYEEACLSIPMIYKKVNRPDRIKVKYYNEKEEEITEELTGMWARAFQHEFDHIDGVLFIDKLSPMNKRLVTKKLEILKKKKKKGNIYREDI